ncbi:hypothetical protein H5410_031968 [Solanum commersonii]|uniref:Uncharacterized protein n=1 Tax=Solanum commersonii TaxID=4109 RepID=A0A9J5YNZ1_SOLCO|nr:hypothetical protein H5410_031968 [Solanum commersonii]
MDPVDCDNQNGQFSRSKKPRAVMETVGHHGQNDPFSQSNEPYSSLWIFVDTKFRHHLFQKFTWTSIKSLAMEQVLTSKTTHFKDQTSPIFIWASVKTLVIEPVSHHSKTDHFLCQTSPRSVFLKLIWTSAKTLAIELVCQHDQNGPCSRSNEPNSR